MRLALLQSRTYAPYTKWLGTAFARLDHADGLDQALADATAAARFEDREQALVTAYELVACRHNALGITEEIDPVRRPYFTRPAQVIDAGRFVRACLATVTDELVERCGLIGSIDQFADNTDVLSNPEAFRKFIAVYR